MYGRPEFQTKPLKKLNDLFFYSSFFISLCSLALTTETHLLAALPLNWPVLLLVFFATLFLYNLDSLLPYKTAQVNVISERKAWLLSHRRFLKMVVIVSGLIAAGLFFYLLPQIPIAFILPIFLVSVLYSLPVFKNKNGRFPLRDVPFLKVFLIAGVWAALTVWLPLLVAGKPISFTAEGLLILRRFLLIFALTLLFDIRDIKKDQLAHTLTFPVKFGTVFTKILSLTALLGFALLVYFTETGAVRWGLEASVLCSGITILSTNPNRSDYFFTLFADGMMMLQFLLVYFALNF